MVIEKLVKGMIFKVVRFQNKSNTFMRITSIDKKNNSICYLKQCIENGDLVKKGYKFEISLNDINNFIESDEYILIYSPSSKFVYCDTQQEFINFLNQKEYSFKVENDLVIINHNGGINLSYLITLPPNIIFENIGYVNLKRLIELPKNIKFNNKGRVTLHN